MPRQAGSKNLYPNKKRLAEAFQEKGFSYVDEWLRIYKAEEKDSVKYLMLNEITEFLFPKRRAEDSEGNPESDPAEVAKATTEIVGEFRELLLAMQEKK